MANQDVDIEQNENRKSLVVNETFKAKCERLGVNYWAALKRRRRGLSEVEIFSVEHLRSTARKTPIIVFGSVYPNIAEARRQIKSPVSEGTIRRRISSGMNVEEAFTLTAMIQIKNHGQRKRPSINSKSEEEREVEEERRIRLIEQESHMKGYWETNTPLSRTKTYKAWSRIVHGVQHKGSRDYEEGIPFDERWHDFYNFFLDVGLPKEKWYSLRRKDQKSGFTKNNCYWKEWGE